MLVLETCIPIIVAGEETFGNARTTKIDKIGETGENGKNNKNGDKEENLGSNLTQVPYIQYHIIFQKQLVPALLDSENEVNAIYPTFAKELGFFIKPIDIGTQKIDSTTLNTYKIVVTAFLMTDKPNQIRFLKKIFLVANVSLKVVLKMFFLI